MNYFKREKLVSMYDIYMSIKKSVAIYKIYTLLKYTYYFANIRSHC